MTISTSDSIILLRTKAIKRHWKRLWKRYLKWPAPLWRLRGYARLSLVDYEFKFFIEDRNIGWARRVRQGKWERGVRDFLKEVLRPGDIFFDVGSWVGSYVLLASRLVQPGGWVYSFEPDPEARRLLERNLAANHVSNATVLPYAVTDREGSAWLDSPRLGWSGTRVTQNGGPDEIQTVTLRTFCERRNIYPSVVKIDVEGAEAKVFDGGIDILQKARAIVLEVHEAELRETGVDPSSFLRSLFTIGKRITILHQNGGDGKVAIPGTELSREAAIKGTVNLGLL